MKKLLDNKNQRTNFSLPIKEKNLTPEDIPPFESDFNFFKLILQVHKYLLRS